ncbi:MAG: GIY-YIG nuclease family protein [bacterium]
MYIYLMRSEETGTYKIGKSKNPEKRLKQLQTGSSEKLELILKFNTKYPSLVESAMHNRFSHLKKHGEWFDLSLSEETSFINECKKIEENIRVLKKLGNVFI